MTDWHEERLNDARLMSQRRGLREGWDNWREAPDAPPPTAMRHALEQALEHGRYRPGTRPQARWRSASR